MNKKSLLTYINRIWKSWYFWIIGLMAFLWVLLRSGTNPKRLVYPCQKAAYPLASAWLVGIISILGGSLLAKRMLKWSVATVALFLVSWIFVSHSDPASHYLNPIPRPEPTWEVNNPVSEIALVDNVPATTGSLAAGNALVPDAYLSDPAIDSLINILNSTHNPFFKTSGALSGIVGSSDVVVIKANFQWRHRLGTNTDRIKGVIWQILNHPEGFSGEILVCDNEESQIWPAEWLGGFNDYSNNSDDTDQSIVDVVNTYKAKGYPVDFYAWDSLNAHTVDEYSYGDLNDGYIFDSVALTSYPKFQSPAGNYISISKGIWDNQSQTYDSEKLTIINFPVLKFHGMVGATVALKNYIGVMNTTKHDEWFGGWVDDTFHPLYCFSDYALVARELEIAWPKLNIVDATWVATQSNYDYNSQVINQNTILASTDPVAVSWYAAKHILTPISGDPLRTDPDAAIGGQDRYSTVFSHWYNYLLNHTSFTITRNPDEISVLSSSSIGDVPVSAIEVTSVGNASSIIVEDSLQFYANVLPSNATDKSITWSVVNETGIATISLKGLLTSTTEGSVQIRATANDGSGVYGSFDLNIVSGVENVTSVEISVLSGGVPEVELGSSLGFEAVVYPETATNKTINWSVRNSTGEASIDNSGVLTPINVGNIWVIGTSDDNNSIADSIEVTINAPYIPVESLTVYNHNKGTQFTEGEEIQFYAEVLPSNSTESEVMWSVSGDNGIASIDKFGLLLALLPGIIWVKATANSNVEIADSMQIIIQAKHIPVSSIEVFAETGESFVYVGENIQLKADVLPNSASNKNYTWRVINESGQASINSSGVLMAHGAGSVCAIAVSEDKPGIRDSLLISIVEKEIPVESINIDLTEDETVLLVNQTLQIEVSYEPKNATHSAIKLALIELTGEAELSSSGKLSAISPGEVEIEATLIDHPEISSKKTILIYEEYNGKDSFVNFQRKNSENLILSSCPMKIKNHSN